MNDGGVTFPAGFRAAGTSCGIKASGVPDLAVLVAEEEATAAGVFTGNRAPAPPVLVSRRNLVASGGRARAVVINSGCANAGTGAAGVADARQTVGAVASKLGCPFEQVLVCSTGPIGPRLPVERILGSVGPLVEAAGGGRADAEASARAILTTDTVVKQVTVDGGGFRVGGMAKGAGMLRPDMATMLAVLTTDAAVEPGILAPLLREAVAVTFNCLDVDGCESTNDTTLLLASGVAGPLGDADALGAAVETACRDLAAKMATDAEGASKVVTLRVGGARDVDTARALGRSVADSALVRASFYGADPNWGRILAALGAAGVDLDPGAVSVAYQGVTVAVAGAAVAIDEDAVSALLAGDFTVDIVVGDGPGGADIVTTDLTPDYVRFNGERS